MSGIDYQLGSIPEQVGYRLVPSKYPPISLFEDVADADEFEAVYTFQAITNPRLRTEAGDLRLLQQAEIPFGIPGCSYAVAPFTHINKNGSRFSDGSFGVLYCGDRMSTAVAEVQYHLARQLSAFREMEYDRLVFRGLQVTFSADPMVDITHLESSHPVYDADSYAVSAAFGVQMRAERAACIQYRSVRKSSGICWGLFTPKDISSVIQTVHYTFVWDGQRISSVDRVRSLTK